VTGEPAATATVAVRVGVPPDAAFRAFTGEIDSWWRRGPKYRHAGTQSGELRLEPGIGGRLFERWADGDAMQEFELGRVTIWSPPLRLAFTWRNRTFAPLERTEVDVTFAAMGTGTLVTVRHRGWESLRSDHPARHGQDDAAFARSVGLWWGEQVTSLREYLASPRGA
jgi:uncharacterized protein YndB with AHSA1/START domain